VLVLLPVSASVEKTKAAVKEAVAKAKATKACGCSKGCNAGCGCRKGGFACSISCGCQTVGCLNPHTYDDDDDGRAALKAAEGAKAKNAIEVAKAKAVAAEKMARRAEAGLY
jgi:hypothetical protein